MVQQCHRTIRKPLRRLHRIGNRQFKHEIGASMKRHLGACPFTYDGGFAALEERAAHHSNDSIRPAKPPGFA
ncbi:hypothetical protein D3C75_1226230 [compost metagenome]